MTKIFFVLLLCLIIASSSGFVNCSDVEKEEKIGIFELKKGDLSLRVTNWGASILSLVIPDKNGIYASSKLQINVDSSYLQFLFSLCNWLLTSFTVICFQESWVMLFLDMILLRITLWVYSLVLPPNTLLLHAFFDYCVGRLFYLLCFLFLFNNLDLFKHVIAINI